MDPVEQYTADYLPTDLFLELRRSVAWPGSGGRKKTYMIMGDPIVSDRVTPMHADVARVVDHLNANLGAAFDTVCLNCYFDGDACLGWHDDDSNEIDQTHPTAIVSFGATRLFQVRHQAARSSIRSHLLQARSLLLMPPGFHSVYEHQVPPMVTMSERISLMLTKRYVVAI